LTVPFSMEQILSRYYVTQQTVGQGVRRKYCLLKHSLMALRPWKDSYGSSAGF
jgi:hypothetical protein